MVLNNFKCNHLMPLHFNGLTNSVHLKACRFFYFHQVYFFGFLAQLAKLLHTDTCNLACMDLLMNPDHTLETRSVCPTSRLKITHRNHECE